MAMLARRGNSPPRSVRAPRPGIRPVIISAAVGLALGLLALGPGLRRGFLLSYDMLFVPREPFSAALPGLAPPAQRAARKGCNEILQIEAAVIGKHDVHHQTARDLIACAFEKVLRANVRLCPKTGKVDYGFERLTY